MRKITPEEYEQWLAEHRPDITVLEPYNNARTPILHRHSCGHEWSARPNCIRSNRGCPSCAAKDFGDRVRLAPEHYPEWLAEDGRGFVALEEYTGTHNKIMHQCSHGHQWSATPRNIKAGWGCPHCSGNIAQDYGEWLSENKPTITALNEYVNTHTAIRHECSEGHTWSAKPHDVKQGTGCPQCAVIKTDNDAIYVFELRDDLGWTGIYKTGLTSWRLGDERIRVGNHRNGTDYRIVALIRTTKGDARNIEKAILDSGEPVTDLPETFVDGRTEVRRFGPRSMATINQLKAIAEGKPIETQKLVARQ